MRIVVCAKEVLDPDAVNNYALAGSLVIGEDGKTLTQTTIPPLMNAYDEQAIEAALQLKEAGADCTITVVSVGEDLTTMLKHAASLGVDDVIELTADTAVLDGAAVARLLAAYVRSLGGADVILCGRQASDDDQGVVPAILGELLDMPVVTVARAVTLTGDGARLQVTRATPDGNEDVECACPAVVTISNEFGAPRYPKTAAKMKVRRLKPPTVSPGDLSLGPEDLEPTVTLTRQFVPAVQGSCEFIDGSTSTELADRLVARLRDDGVLQ